MLRKALACAWWVELATIRAPKRSPLMPTRKHESPKERDERLKLEARRKSERVAAEDAAVERLIRENIRLYGA